MRLFDRPLKYVGVDNIHWDISPLLSKNKPLIFAASGRLPGKTSSVLRMLYRQFYDKDRTFVLLKRLIADITTSTITQLEDELNKFLSKEDKVKFVYSKGDIKNGIFGVYVYPANEKTPYNFEDSDHLFFKVVALSVNIDRQRANLSSIPNLEWIWFDECCVSKKLGSKYLPLETDIFSNLYNTVYRNSKNLRCIFTYNPYSRWNPYLAMCKVPLDKLKVGEILVGSNYAVECIKLKPELVEWVKQHNKLIELEEEEQIKFIIEGGNVEDNNILIQEKQPIGSTLIYVFRVNNKYIGVYRMKYEDVEIDCKYWCSIMENYETSKKKVVCFNSYDLSRVAHLVQKREKNRFEYLVKAYKFYQICYRDIETATYMEDVFENIM